MSLLRSWKVAGLLAAIAVAVLIVLVARGNPPKPATGGQPLPKAGDCIQLNGVNVTVVSCTAKHDGKILKIVQSNADCPPATTNFVTSGGAQGASIMCVGADPAS